MTQQSLFPTNEPQEHNPPGFEFGFLSVAAHRKVAGKFGDTFSFFSSEVAEGGFILTGATSSGVRTKGRRKGQPRWDGETHAVIVSRQDVVDAESAYERDTGMCHRCLGNGKEWYGWGVETGNRYRDCSRCGATGKAQ